MALALHMAIVKTRFGMSDKAQILQGQPTWTLRPAKPNPGLLSRQLDGRARRSICMHVCLGRLCMPACKPEGLREEAVRVAVVAPGPLPSGSCFRRLIAVHLPASAKDLEKRGSRFFCSYFVRIYLCFLVLFKNLEISRGWPHALREKRRHDMPARCGVPKSTRSFPSRCQHR